MRHRRLFCYKVGEWVLVFSACYFLILCYLFCINKEAHKVRYRAQELPDYKCPLSEAVNLEGGTNTSTGRKAPPFSVSHRILLITGLDSGQRQRLIVSFLDHLKVPVRVENLEAKAQLLALAGIGRFSLILFDDYRLFYNLPSDSQNVLLEYCRKHKVGLISFLSGSENEEDFGIFSARGQQHAHSLRFPKKSPVSFVGKSSSTLPFSEPYLPNWTLFIPSSNASASCTPILEVEDVYGSRLSAGILVNDSRTGVEHIVFSHGPQYWMIKIALLDSLIYMAPNLALQDLERLIQIDIDDVFVGQTGSRFIPEDVLKLKETQQDLQKFIEGFLFDLGFSGYFFRHGDSLEIKGDEQLVESNEFRWFPHMWRHNHAHEYSDDYLMALMAQNKMFANNMKLPPLPSYAVSPQHSGVYPIYEPLYKSWKSVWGVRVTSTEEYPHLRPASARRGFIHSNVSVLPRQTCGLFTHTSFFHSYPDGVDNMFDNIFGGDLFLSVLMNKFSIFMTHQQNFANDRLGSFTFRNLVRFLGCWTNLKLNSTTPVDLARRYFEEFPKEKKLVYTNPCSDARHKKMLPLAYQCSKMILPNLIILGPQKTGTSALSLFLSLHPNISTNSLVVGSFEELQFFGGSNYPRGLDWYADKFSNVSEQAGVVFEKSANYFDSDDAPMTLHALLPNAKLIVIMIDPVDRAYSWYQHIAAHNDSLAGNFTADQVFMGNFSEAERLRKRCLWPGLYAQHLDRWLDFFPPSQIVLVDGKRLRYEPNSVVNEVLDQLPLSGTQFKLADRLKFVPEKGFYCVIKDKERRLKCLGQSKGRKYPQMSFALRTYLSDFYREHNSALLGLLHRYKFAIPSFLIAGNN